MPIARIFSRDVDFKGFRIRNSILDPVPTTTRDVLASGLTVSDEGYQVYDTTADAPYYWNGSAWVTPGGGGGSGFLPISYSAFQALTGGSTTIPYYITTTGKEGFWYYVTTVADQSTDNEGTIIVTADLKQYKRSYIGPLNITWFGGVADAVAMSGTSNTAAFDKMQAAAAVGEPMLIGKGDWYFATAPNPWTNAKKMDLTVLGNTYHNGVDFIRINQSAQRHRLVMKGFHYGKDPATIPTHTKATYDANTDPDWATFNGAAVHIQDSIRANVYLSHAEGFKYGFFVESGTVGGLTGCQENRFEFDFLFRNAFGIYLKSSNVNAFNDKNYFLGGRIGGDVAITFDGGVANDGSMLANYFNNVLIEAANSGIIMRGKARYTLFHGCRIEGGDATGIFGTTKIDMASDGTVDATQFIGMETLQADWFNSIGKNTTITATPTLVSNAGTIGSVALAHQTLGRITMMGSTSFNRTLLPLNFDSISFTAGTPKPNSQFAYVKQGNPATERALSFDGQYLNVTSAGTYVAPIPLGYIRLAAGTGAVVLTVAANQIYDGNYFFIEQVGTGTLEIQRDSDNVVFMNTSQITSPGYYFVRYVNAGAFAFVPTKLGGSVSSFNPVGSTPNASAASVSGTVLTLQPASVNFPGVVTTLTQQFGGDKELIGDMAVRKGTATTLIVENTSVTESTLSSLNVLSIVGAAFLKVNTNSILELGRKDNTASSSVVFSNGKTFGSGRLWSVGTNPSNNHLIINNQGTAANALSIQSANNNVRIGTSTADPGVKFQVDGDIKINAGSLFLGNLASDPIGLNGQGYYNTTSNKFRAFENSAWVDWIGVGGGGSGVTSFGPVGAGNPNGGSVSGTVATLHVANSTQPGLWSTGTQTLPGLKTYTATQTFRVGSVSSGTAPIKIPPASALMNIEEQNSIEHWSGDLYWTNTISRQKLITTNNVAIFTNKTWQGAPIDPAYGGRDTAWEDGAPTYTFGTGAGTGPTNASPASNTNSSGVINITTGSAPASSSAIITLTFSAATASTGSVVVFAPGNQNAAGQSLQNWAVMSGTTQWSLRQGTSALGPSTNYIWHYYVRKLPGVGT